MIPIEQQVISLALAQRLAALGVAGGDSYFAWCMSEDVATVRLWPARVLFDEFWPAYSVPELVALLLERITNYELRIKKATPRSVR